MYAHSRNIDTHAGIYTQAPQLKPITFGKCQFKYYLLWKTGQLPAPSPILVILSSQPYPPPPHSPQYLSDDTAITEGLPPDCELCGSVPSVVPQPWTALSTGPLNCCQLTEESFREKEDGANRGLKKTLGCSARAFEAAACGDGSRGRSATEKTCPTVPASRNHSLFSKLPITYSPPMPQFDQL